jgi:hypothetical protein
VRLSPQVRRTLLRTSRGLKTGGRVGYADGGDIPPPRPAPPATPDSSGVMFQYGHHPAEGDDQHLMVVHNTRASRLKDADDFGGLSVPSLGIVSPKHGFKSFGNVTLIGHPDMAKPSADNPVFASDVYSPRFPRLSEDKKQAFNRATGQFEPATQQNVVNMMKGDLRGGSDWGWGAGAVRAGITPQFDTQQQIKQARNKIVPSSKFGSLKQQTDKELLDLGSAFHPHSVSGADPDQHQKAFVQIMQNVAKNGPGVFDQHYKDLPPELAQRAQDHLHHLRDMETEYFEAKPQRLVPLHEFIGAVIPQSERQTLMPLLHKHGIKKIVAYGRQSKSREDIDEDRRQALHQFPEAMFHFGGAVKKAGGSISSPGVNAALRVTQKYLARKR